MRVTVSIPEPVFAEAEVLTKRMNATRSEIYTRALDAFLDAHAPDRITAALDEVVEATGGTPDRFAGAAARRMLDHVEW